MPLTDIGAASLSHMADTKLPTSHEIVALGAWIEDLRTCRERLLGVPDATIPSFGPIIESSWNDDNLVFVKLEDRKKGLGEAVMSLQKNRSRLRADLYSRAVQVAAEIGKLHEAQLNRRTTIITSIIGILPCDSHTELADAPCGTFARKSISGWWKAKVAARTT